MDTEPLPRIPAHRAEPVRARGGLRALEMVAGLLSSGLVVIGLTLVVLQVFAADIAPGTGPAAASGPGWGRTVGQLGVGAAGELAVALRRRLGHASRTYLAVGVIVAAGVVLWLSWWA